MDKIYDIKTAYPWSLTQDISTTYESDLAWLNEQIKMIAAKHDKHGDEVFVDLSFLD